MNKPPVRNRNNLPQSSRDIDFISMAEIKEAILLVAAKSHGMQEDKIAAQVSRLCFGFGAIRDKSKKRINDGVVHLELSGELQRRDDHLVI